MARIRSVKPELRRDLTVAEWPRDCRYAWVLLWGYLDDHGRGLDDLRLLTADLFPLDRDVTERKLDGWLNKMAADSAHGAAPLCRYQIDGRRYLHAPKWSRSQRVSHPQDSKIPPCPIHEAHPNGTRTPPDPRANGSGTVPQVLATSRAPEDLGVKGAREQGVKGAGCVVQTAHTPADLAAQILDDTGPYVPKVRAALATELEPLIAAGIPTPALTSALHTWRGRRKSARFLPLLVQDQLTPTQQQDPRFAGLLADARSSA